MNRNSVRSTSGTAIVIGLPNIRADASSFGRWSTVLAENMLWVPIALISERRYNKPEIE